MAVTTLKVAGPQDRLDRFLASQLPDLSRSRIQSLIRQGKVHVDGLPAKASQALSGGQQVRIDVPPEPSTTLEPEPIPLRRVAQGPGFVAIDKPAGLAVHPGAGRPSGTLLNALLARFPQLGDWPDQRPGIVHRLDRDTSGLVLVALDPPTRDRLQRLFRHRKVEKVYLGIVHGLPQTPRGLVDSPIRRHRQRMAVHPEGRPAQTEFRVLERLGSFSLLEIRPRTGRTHQIRVHLAAIGHPVLGDTVYGRRQRGRRPPAGRQMLHAWRLAFDLEGRHFKLEAPVPEDFRRVLRYLGSQWLRAPSSQSL